MKNTFTDIMDKCKVCNKCNLCESRKNVVWGYGNEKAEIMLIGEAPGANEDETGMPFVGRSGILLDKMLNDINLYRDKNIYIANIVKCRPPQNRNPNSKEINSCIDWLYSQIDIIKPKIIVCLGAVPSKKLISKDIKVTKQHGEFFNINNIYYTPFYHPSALLRNPHNKPISGNDYKLLKEKISKICKYTY